MADRVSALAHHVVHEAQPRDRRQAHLLLPDDTRDREGPRGNEDSDKASQASTKIQNLWFMLAIYIVEKLLKFLKC